MRTIVSAPQAYQTGADNENSLCGLAFFQTPPGISLKIIFFVFYSNTLILYKIKKQGKIPLLF
jgi:hypothetical protein